MSNILLAQPVVAPALLAESPTSAARVTDRNLIRSERIKFTSVRSNLGTLFGATAAFIGLGALFATFASSGGPGPRDASSIADSLTLSFAGLNLAQIVLGVLGAMFVASEYSSGLIRTVFAAAPKRLGVLRAKTIVIGTVTWATMTIAAFATFFAGQALYNGSQATYGLFDSGVLRVILGSGVYAAGIALMGVALGFLLRSTAAAVATLFGVLLIAPGLISLLPSAFSDPVTKYLPSEAGAAFHSLHASSGSLSPTTGFVVFAAWIVGLLGVAAWGLRKRDA